VVLNGTSVNLDWWGYTEAIFVEGGGGVCVDVWVLVILLEEEEEVLGCGRLGIML
jgi:hypothetical protein